MIVYSGSKTQFLQSVEMDTIAEEIQKNVLSKLGRHTVSNEYESWENSYQYMYKVMADTDIPGDAGIAIEYNIPQTAKRVDFMVSGYDKTGKPGMVIVELKQWSRLDKVEQSNALVETYTGNALRRVVHPSYQAWSYAQLISDYNSVVQDEKVTLAPCALLHNYIRQDDDPVDDEQYALYTNEAPVFTKGQVFELRDFIKHAVIKGDNGEILYRIDHGKIRPSKSLQDAIVSMVKGNEEFTMIDEQRVVFEDIIRISEKCMKDHQKRTVICQGGPGTGKSVVAVRLLAELTRRGQFVQYASKNQAPRQVYLSKLKGKVKKSGVDNLFKGSAVYTKVGRNQIHTILVDEAHRLEARSQYTKAETGNENQIREIIHAAGCSVFFIDESQRVTMKDIGSVEEIKLRAAEEGSEVIEMELTSQFRCNGSDGYLAWLDDMLEIRDTANYDLDGIDYDFEVLDSPEELRQKIVEKNHINNKARILAGYCWNWPKKSRADTNFHDIKIGDFEISWNLDTGEPFATGEDSVNEAGCIHTTQGLEFDYAGVIIGDDLRYQDGHVIADYTKRASTDQSVKGLKKLYAENPEEGRQKEAEIIKNTYRTLMTRGMKGCYVYCTDPALADYMRRRLKAYAEGIGIKKD